MTISNTNRVAGPFTGNGVAVAFPFYFKVFSAADLVVVRGDLASVLTTLALTTNYTVTLNTDQNGSPGGTVTLLVPPPTGYTLTISSNIANLQPMDLTNGGGFYPNVINDAVDRSTIQIQQIAAAVARTLQIPLGDGLSAMTAIPLVAARTGRVLGFDGTGNPTAGALISNLDAAVAAYLGGVSIGQISSVASVAAMRALLKANLVDGNIINLLGYTTRGDGAQGYFEWVAASTATVDNGIVFAAGEGGTGRWIRIFFGHTDPSWFYSIRDGGADDALAWQGAINYWNTSDGGRVQAGSGAWTFKSQVTISQSRVHVRGSGKQTTRVFLEPTANCIAFAVNAGSVPCVQGSIMDIGIRSNDTLYTKTGIFVTDISDYSIWNISVGAAGTAGFYAQNSVGVRIAGRDTTSLMDWGIYAARPVVISQMQAPHVANGIGIDHFNFHNMYLIPQGHPAVEVEDGLIQMTQVSFTGRQAWPGGTYGFYWNDTTSVGQSEGLIIENLRTEQGEDATKNAVYISHNYGFQGIHIRGGYIGDRRGFYYRKCSYVKHEGTSYALIGAEAINFDGSCNEVSGNNCFWQATSTATITNQRLVFATPKYPSTGALPPTFHYTNVSNTTHRMTLGDTVTFTPSRAGFTEVPGAGSITATGRYTYVGNHIKWTIVITCAGGATIASSMGASYLLGLPNISQPDTCQAVRSDVMTSLGNGYVNGNYVYPPAWGAAAGTFVLSGMAEMV